jgi:hypothetical protein
MEIRLGHLYVYTHLIQILIMYNVFVIFNG